LPFQQIIFPPGGKIHPLAFTPYLNTGYYRSDVKRSKIKILNQDGFLSISEIIYLKTLEPPSSFSDFRTIFLKMDQNYVFNINSKPLL